MEDRKVKNGDLVLPGDYLGVIEEFMPGEGVREENGELYATRAGRVRINPEKMEISVEPVTDTPPLPQVGDIGSNRPAPPDRGQRKRQGDSDFKTGRNPYLAG